MTRSGKSLWIFGIYVLFVAAGLLLVPNTMLGLLQLPQTNQIWPRIVGIPLVLLGSYYFLAGRNDLMEFIRWSVFARASVILFYVAFIVIGLAQPILILFGVVDLLGALWTGLALRTERVED